GKQIYFEPVYPCGGIDCRAAKGFGIVRVLGDAETQMIYDVVFTHLQADDEYWGQRRYQLIQLEGGVRHVLGFDFRRHEEIVVMGDLNVNGDFEPGLPWEYELDFGDPTAGTPGVFFGGDLGDSWAKGTS